jgi:RNA polymerase sigma-70 factor (ECF subfamily)
MVTRLRGDGKRRRDSLPQPAEPARLDRGAVRFALSYRFCPRYAGQCLCYHPCTEGLWAIHWQIMNDDVERGAVEGTSHHRDWSSLMARAQDGDKQAYRMLLEDAIPYLRSLAARRLRNPGDIDDSVQDILLTVHAVRHTYDPRRPFGPWLVAIANRRIIDRLRRRIRSDSREVEFTPDRETFSYDATNLHEEASADPEALQQAIERLPPDQREAIRLLKLKEMSLKEAAAVSGRSISALKVATHRAIRSLRKKLEQPSETP